MGSVIHVDFGAHNSKSRWFGVTPDKVLVWSPDEIEDALHVLRRIGLAGAHLVQSPGDQPRPRFEPDPSIQSVVCHRDIEVVVGLTHTNTGTAPSDPRSTSARVDRAKRAAESALRTIASYPAVGMAAAIRGIRYCPWVLDDRNAPWVLYPHDADGRPFAPLPLPWASLGRRDERPGATPATRRSLMFRMDPPD